ncbi:hypothetical protein ACQ4WX_46115 [Streptomyces lasalocidi]
MAERERAALRRGALVALGASGEDLTDAERLLIWMGTRTRLRSRLRPRHCVRGARSCSARSVLPWCRRLRPGAPRRGRLRRRGRARPGLETARRRGLVAESGDAR